MQIFTVDNLEHYVVASGSTMALAVFEQGRALLTFEACGAVEYSPLSQDQVIDWNMRNATAKWFVDRRAGAVYYESSTDALHFFLSQNENECS